MWHDLGLDIPITEGTYWLDNQIVKAFDTEGNICFLYRLLISADLELSYKKHKNYNKYKNNKYETWNQTIERNTNRLKSLEDESISLLRQHGINTDRKIIDTNSTGKDSMVKTFLAHKAGLQFETYFNVTTLDVAESNRMAKEEKFIPVRPDKKYGGFYKWREHENIMPSRLNRCCCRIFKEEPTINAFDENERLLFLFGMRNDESNSRSGYEDVWINNKWGKRDWVGILPIRKWTDIDIWLYIFQNNIKYNLKYTYGYDRVGCGIACPNYSKTTWILDKYYYPKMYERWQNILKEDFIKNNKWLIMNCTIKEYLRGAWTGGVFRVEPTDETIQEYADYSNLDLHIAKKYFNKYCSNGCLNNNNKPLRIKNKEVLAMNMKMFGREIEKFMCKKCLMKELGIDNEIWQVYIDSFKLYGCDLF